MSRMQSAPTALIIKTNCTINVRVLVKKAARWLLKVWGFSMSPADGEKDMAEV